MEVRSLKLWTISAVPASLIRRDLIGKGFVNGRIFKLSKSDHGNLAASKVRIIRVTSRASDGFGSVSPVEAVSDSFEKDDNVVFVGGATGRVGSRTVRELLKLGFRVRAGVRSPQKAEALVESVKKIQDANSPVQPVERLELVECDLEKTETIIPALGKAAVVICCIGASEKEVFDVTGPYRIDYLATKNLVDAAAVAKARHFIMVSSLGTNKFGFPAAILNLFWGVLFWKRKAEEALIASGIPYTIVRPGGMERPTDVYKETHNIRLSEEDTLFGGQVSNLQVAELMAFMAKNRRLSYCKVVEVIAETSAPLRPLDELLAEIPYQRDPPKELDSPVRSSPESREERVPEPESDLQEEPVEVTTLPKPKTENIEVKPVEASATITITRPLSPFTAYEDLKPPTSPSPSPPASTSAAVKADRDSKPSDTATPEAPNMPVEEAPGLIDTLLPEAVLATSPNLPDSNIIDGATAGSLPTDSQTPILRPQSPFTVYEDLKPPSSPSPITSGFRDIPTTASPPVQTSSVNPESAPTPEQELPPTNNRGTTDQDTKKQETPRVATHYHSPYYAYEDFKPPTSPSPAPPLTNSSIHPSSSPNGGLATNVINTPNKKPSIEAPEQAQITEKVQYTKPKSSPLSPFTMYEDLKPPTSPVPSPWVGKV